MKVLIACEESQTVCKAFRALGYEAYSCDVQEPSGGPPEWHILGDALPLLTDTPTPRRHCCGSVVCPPLKPTNVVTPTRTWCPSGSYTRGHEDRYRGEFTTDRARNRAKTFPGIAAAMAEQWGGDIR